MKSRNDRRMSARIPGLRFFTRALWVAAVLAAFASVFVAANLRSPYLLVIRETAFRGWMAAGILALGFLIFRGRRIMAAPHLIAVSVLLGSILAGHGAWRHERHRDAVMSASRERFSEVGKHLMIGWLGFEETRALAAKGAIAGVFIGRSDFPRGSSAADIRKTVDLLQGVRREAGLPPLWIATDQEGGPVSRLSPAVVKQPGLGTWLTDLDGPGLADQPERQAEIIRRVTEYAEVQARSLAEAGINLNLAPVVDLRPSGPPGFLDSHTKISTRALAADPHVVALAGETYVRVLAKHSITGVLKHFPGLGRVPEDTHHFAAHLDLTKEQMESNDWIPFRRICRNTKTGIMLGHVNLTAIDPDRPASCSAKVARGLIREEWGMTGLLVTDDFAMAPISHGPGGIVRAARASIAAGVDLVLISYDASVVYDLLAILTEQ
ncbi:MAG: glycoside hydrolase family 3 protein [Verrucomicrobiaceae bacterium]|nr:MAG: glycoside hydrolase family 3 protein [Verrucomicrobiaceae bacterium]